MKEHLNVRQIPGEAPRRWFCSNDFDLIVWLSRERGFLGFELCYDKQRNEHSISWTEAGGFHHMAVDDGEQRPGKYKASPVLLPDGLFDARRVYSTFREASRALPEDVASYVLRALERHPQFCTAI